MLVGPVCSKGHRKEKQKRRHGGELLGDLTWKPAQHGPAIPYSLILIQKSHCKARTYLGMALNRLNQ